MSTFTRHLLRTLGFMLSTSGLFLVPTFFPVNGPSLLLMLWSAILLVFVIGDCFEPY